MNPAEQTELSLALMRTAEDLLRQARQLKNFDPDQPRHPKGSSVGGQWKDTDKGGRVPAGKPTPLHLLGRNNTGTPVKPSKFDPPEFHNPDQLPGNRDPNALPARKPSAFKSPSGPKQGPPSPQEFARRINTINSFAPPGTRPQDLELDPVHKLPKWYIEAAKQTGLSDDAIAGIALGVAKNAALQVATGLVTGGGVGGVARIAAPIIRARTVTNTLKHVKALTPKQLAQSLDDFIKAGKRDKTVKQIERFLGGKPMRAEHNKAGDPWMMRENKQFRADINRPGVKNGKIDKPHFHLRIARQKNTKTVWDDAPNTEHRIYFEKGE